MYYCEWLGFHNTRYIKNQTELFSKTLTDLIHTQFNRDYLLISDILTDADISGMETHKTKLYANVSLSDIKIEIPFLSENEKLRTFVCSLLQKTHDFVKKYLADVPISVVPGETSNIKVTYRHDLYLLECLLSARA